jgi:hypothetical protein
VLKPVSSVYTYHKVGCPVCDNRYSYPERFIGCVLDSLNVDYVNQFSPSWLEGRRYDFMFTYANIKYVAEADGAFHYNDNFMNGQTKEETKKIDDWKDEKAIENGFRVIRIDCNYKYGDRADYIINSLRKSEFSEIFNLDDVDFKLCKKNADKSKLVSVSDLWNSGIHSFKELLSITGYKRDSLRKTLYKAAEIGLTNENKDEIVSIIQENAHKESGLAKRISVRCIETGEIFEKTRTAILKYPGRLQDYFAGKIDYSGMLPDGTKLHWEKV